MIVVIGSPIGRTMDGTVTAAGMSSRVALAAARAGATVQLVGKTGDDPTADAVVLHLAHGGVGHVALLRESARATPLERPAEEDADEDAATATLLETDVEPFPGAEQIPPTPTEGPVLDATDVDLGLRYLTEFKIVVVAEPSSPDLIAIVAEAARWSGARMVLVVGPGSSVPDGLPPDVIVFEAPAEDPDGVFADLVGSFAAALDEGVEPGDAFRTSVDSDGWTGVAAD